ncbi:MAG: hypothetical protein K2J39_07050 [Ruminococcus sp.]|nr:hypothetical protein [Ruminococcus sp.]
MSRSFQVSTEKNPDFTAEDILNIIETLRDSDKEINLKNIRIINHSENYYTFVTEDCIVHITFHSTEWKGKIDKWWSIGSRSLDGMGKNLFVACASAVAILSDSYASSGDGAFTPDIDFTGHELWETYLDSRPHITVSTMNGDTIYRSKSEVKKLIMNSLNDDILISIGQNYPCLAILINGNYACIHYFESENGHIFQSTGDVNKEVTFIAGGTEWTAPPESVVTLVDAVICAESFINNLSRTEWIEWTEL